MTILRASSLPDSVRAKPDEFSIEDQIRLISKQFGVDPKRAAVLLGQVERVADELVQRISVPLPFDLVVPWSELCSDNERKSAAQTRLSDGNIYPRLRTSKRYKAARDAIAERAKEAVGRAHPLTIPLAINVRVWLPPSRRNDALNFAKVVHDALEGIVYANDNQLHEVHWYRAGVDIDRPRAEIEITPADSRSMPSPPEIPRL